MPEDDGGKNIRYNQITNTSKCVAVEPRKLDATKRPTEARVYRYFGRLTDFKVVGRGETRFGIKCGVASGLPYSSNGEEHHTEMADIIDQRCKGGASDGIPTFCPCRRCCCC